MFAEEADSATGALTAVPPLRTLYRDRLLVLAALDAASTVENEPVLPFTVVGEHLSDLADAALAAALRVVTASVCGDKPSPVLTIIAMGKCGARELNYVSDVDVVLVGEALPGGDDEAALRTATQLVRAVVRVCGQVAWPVDAGPAGSVGRDGAAPVLLRRRGRPAGRHRRPGRRHRPGARRGHHGDRRGLGVGEVDAAPVLQPARRADVGHGPVPRRRRGRPRPAGPPSAGRDGVPGAGGVPGLGRRQPADRATRPRRRGGARRARPDNDCISR